MTALGLLLLIIVFCWWVAKRLVRMEANAGLDPKRFSLELRARDDLVQLLYEEERQEEEGGSDGASHHR